MQEVKKDKRLREGCEGNVLTGRFIVTLSRARFVSARVRMKPFPVRIDSCASIPDHESVFGWLSTGAMSLLRAFPNSSKEGKLTQDEASSLGLEVSL